MPGPPERHATQLGFEALGTPLFDTTFVVLDLETTGLRAGHDRITEIGAVKVRGGEVLGELRTFVHPGTPIPAAITAVTGITDRMVRDAPTLPRVWPTVRRFLGGAVFVAHNAAFDLGFLRAAAEACGDDRYEPFVVDTARLARRLVRDEVRDCRLGTLAAHFRARTRPEHRALADARATVDVLHGLIERAGSHGATTVEDLHDLTRSSSHRAFARRDLVADAPVACGVYRFLDARGEVLYVGKATDLRSRLRTYFGQDPRRRIEDMVRETESVRWETTPTLLEAEVRELRAIHRHRPRFNRRSTDPEAAVHIAVTAEPFPRLSIVREPRPSHRASFGPLPSRRAAEALLEAVHAVVPLRTCTTRLRRAQDHPACVLKDLGRCGAPCDGTIGTDAHAEVVTAATALFTDASPLLEGLRESMAHLATSGRYEEAARARSRLHRSAHALQALRRHRSITAADVVIAVRTSPTGHEVVAVRGGLLEATLVVPGEVSDAELAGDVRVRRLIDASSVGPTPSATRHDAEEVTLVAGWLHRPGTRVLHVQGPLAEPLAGGRALATATEEARQLARRLRQDRQQLSGAKVRTRTG